jgi:hypothetical protein
MHLLRRDCVYSFFLAIVTATCCLVYSYAYHCAEETETANHALANVMRSAV